MRNYTAHDVQEMFKSHEQHISHVIVAHTYHRPYIASQIQGRFKNVKEQAYYTSKIEQTSKDCRYAMNCFAKLLYPKSTNKPVRQPLTYRPLSFVTIEGAKQTNDRKQTVHVNIMIGNLPDCLTTDDIETLFRHAWHDKAKQSEDINVQEYYDAIYGDGFEGYSLKEGQQDKRRVWADDSIWDVSNCWIPHNALKVD